MNELMRVAGEYFNRMEGRHLYPGWRTRHWYMVLLSSAAFIGFAWYGFVRLNDHQVSGMLLAPLLAAEFGIIWATDGVTRYRRKKLTGADIKHQAKANEQIDPLRVGADSKLSHRADPNLSQGWTPSAGRSSVDKYRFSAVC